MRPNAAPAQREFTSAGNAVGVDAITVGKLRGDVANRTIVQRYTHSEIEQLRTAAEKIAGYLLTRAGAVAQEPTAPVSPVKRPA
jgi:hypothetical protein